MDPGHGRTLEVPHHPEVVLVTGVAGVGDVLGRGIDRHRNHVRVQPGPAAGGSVPGILPPQKAEPGPFLKKPPNLKKLRGPKKNSKSNDLHELAGGTV